MSSSVPGRARGAGLVAAASPRLFYGWIVVGVCFAAQMVTSLAMQGLSTYVGPLQAEFGWSAGATAAGRSIQQSDTFLGPVNGWLVDKFGPRRLMFVGAVLFAFSFALFGVANSLWTYYVACLLMALANSLLGLLVVSYSLNRWFRRKRTFAMGLAVAGFGVGGAAFIPALVWAQAEYGWRVAALGSALGILLLVVPVMLLMRDAPEAYGLLRDGDVAGRTDPTAGGSTRGGGLVDYTLRQAVRTRTFWCITLGSTFVMLVQSALSIHQFPHLERALDRETVAFVVAAMNVVNIGGRLVGGVLGDRVPKHTLLGVVLVGATAGVALVALATSLWLLLLYATFFGFAWGVRAAVLNSLLGEYFGRVAYGRIVGLTQTLASPGAFAAPIAIGMIADVTGSYETPFLALTVASALSAVLFLAATPPSTTRQPAHAEG
ncbi:MAG: MFS transporter [Chloroflexi bacterium]|nr:MFS transporter [Chloroflexota bacterium]